MLSLKAQKIAIFSRHSDKLQLDIKRYMSETVLSFRDANNGRKTIVDALKTKVDGLKKNCPLNRIRPMDKQVYRVAIEKGLAPPPKRRPRAPTHN